MNAKHSLLAAGFLLAGVTAGFGHPEITTPPQPCTNAIGTTAIFTVEAAGTEPLFFQWQRYDAYWFAWVDLVGCTNSALCLTNVQASHDGYYRVVITNLEGSVTSDFVRLTILVPPSITPTTSLQHTAVFRGSNATFSVTASGPAPFAYQWRRDGTNLLGKTASTLQLLKSQPADEGDYSVVVSNPGGAVTSEAARLWVVPPITEFIRGNFTNTAGQGMPYFYWVPTNYSATRSYSLACSFHGVGDDVNVFPTRMMPERLICASYRLQATDPSLIVYPTRWNLNEAWTDLYLQLTSGLLDQMISRFNIDTNRVTVSGYSQGVYAAWDLMGMRPGFFASADVGSGWPGKYPASAVKDVPLWAVSALDDGGLSNTRNLVRTLRLAGGNPIYTEYKWGGHLDGILMHTRTPAMIERALGQRRGVATTNEPLLTITSPTTAPVFRTGAMAVNLAGYAGACGQAITNVAWENTANARTGTATGSNAWNATSIPLSPGQANLIIVTATTTSWAPAYGGSTTFNDTLTVIQSKIPLRATLSCQGSNLLLSWTGGFPPFRVQQATDLHARDWTDLLLDATSPVALPSPPSGEAGFYRIVGQ